MSWGPLFVIAIITISTTSWLINNWLRARHGYALEDEWGGKTKQAGLDTQRKLELLSHENEKLTSKITYLEERVAVLERIATDSASRLSDEIESLRDK